MPTEPDKKLTTLTYELAERLYRTSKLASQDAGDENREIQQINTEIRTLVEEAWARELKAGREAAVSGRP